MRNSIYDPLYGKYIHRRQLMRVEDISCKCIASKLKFFSGAYGNQGGYT